MALHELDEQIHKQDADIRETHVKSEFNPESAKEVPEKISVQTTWSNQREGFFAKYPKQMRLGLLTIGGIAFFTLCIGIFVRIQQSLFLNNRIRVSISGPENINSSNLNHFVISYENGNYTRVRDAVLLVSYPPNFYPEGNVNEFRNDSGSSSITIGDIPAFGTGKVDFSGKFYGSKNSVAYIRSALRYKSNDAEARFSPEGQKSINLRSSSISIEIDAPLSVASNSKVDYAVNYENISDVALSNIRLKVSYPSGFSFKSSDPSPSEGDTVWYIGNISSGEKGSVRLTGTLSGVSNEKKSFSVDMGTLKEDGSFFSYSTAERSTQMTASPIIIQQFANQSRDQSVGEGDSVGYTINFKNNSSIGLRNIIVTATLKGDAFNFYGVQPSGGFFESSKSMITWKASDVPQLENLLPGQSGSVSFIVPIRSNLLYESKTSKNFHVTTWAAIESPDIQNPLAENKIIATDTLDVKVHTAFSLEAFASYTNDKISNSGPNPPKVGEETTYTIHWLLSNTTNDIAEVEVSSSFPTNIRWTGKIFPPSEAIFCNERTNKIVWNVGNIGVGVGTLSPKREVIFQLSVRPDINQQDGNVMLLGNSMATARDLFTNKILRSGIGGVSSSSR